MTVNRTTLLDLPIITTGTETGTWGDITNNGLTEYVDIAIAGRNALTSSDFTAGALTLALTEGDSGGTNIAATSAQYSTLYVSSLAVNSEITAPASNRAYRVINADSTYTLTVKASGQTGVTFAPGTTGIVAFNGTDYAVIGTIGAASSTDNAVARFDGTTGKLIQNSVVTIADTTGNIAGLGDITFGTQASKATLTYATNTARTLTVPNVGGNRTFAFIDQAQTFSADQTIAGNLTLNAQGDVRFADSDSSNWVAFQAPATVASNVTWTLPSADGTSGQVLSTNGSGTLSWASGGGGGSPGGSDTQVQFNDGGSFGGDAGLTYNKTTDVLTVSGGAVLQGLTAGRGAGAVSSNTAFGDSALGANTTGSLNVAIGQSALPNNSIGSGNVAVGRSALNNNTTGSDNTAVGLLALYNVTTGTKNLALGGGDNTRLSAGSVNNVIMSTTDFFNVFSFTPAGSTQLDGLNAGRGAGRVASNVAFGSNALAGNTTGAHNVAIGRFALSNSTSGTENVAVGSQVLELNTTGSSNTCMGRLAGYNITTGAKNVSIYGGDGGNSRLTAGSVGIISIGTLDNTVFDFNTTIGTQLDGFTAGKGGGRVASNVAFGSNALAGNTTGAHNVAIGRFVMASAATGNENVGVGSQVLELNTTGSNNTCMGRLAGYNITTGAKNVSIYGGDGGNSRLTAGSVGIISIGTLDGERLRIETAAFKAQLVYDQTTGSAANVFVASDGKMSRSTSSQRYKKNIQDAVHGLDKVLQLRSVTFNHINPDEAGIVYGGLIAEEVHDLGLTEFVEYTWDGRPDSLRYGHMVSLLVKAVQELNARVVALETQGV